MTLLLMTLRKHRANCKVARNVLDEQKMNRSIRQVIDCFCCII